MANNCATDYQIEGEKSQIEFVYGEFKKLLDTPRTCIKDGKTVNLCRDWLGYVVTDILKKKVEEVPCRGTFDIVEEVSELPGGNYGFKLFTDTAWCACSDLFERLGKQFNLDVYFLEIEPGCDIFYTNDAEGHAFPQRYYLDSDIEGEEYFESFEDLANRVEEITGTLPIKMEDMDSIIDLYEGDFLSVHEIEYSQY